MQKELPLHQIEREVMEPPTQHCHADLKVETSEVGQGVIIVATLPPEDRKGFEGEVDGNGSGRRPPDYRVTDKVHLAVFFAPEVDATLQDRP